MRSRACTAFRERASLYPRSRDGVHLLAGARMCVQMYTRAWLQVRVPRGCSVETYAPVRHVPTLRAVNVQPVDATGAFRCRELARAEREVRGALVDDLRAPV